MLCYSRGYLLLVTSDTRPPRSIFDEELRSIIEKKFSEKFHVVQEYPEVCTGFGNRLDVSHYDSLVFSSVVGERHFCVYAFWQLQWELQFNSEDTCAVRPLDRSSSVV